MLFLLWIFEVFLALIFLTLKYIRRIANGIQSMIFFNYLYIFTSPFEWKAEHGDQLLKHILIVEPYRYKQMSMERRNFWTQIVDIFNSIEEPKFRAKQRAVRGKLKLLESTLKKKIDEEEKAIGINSIGVSNIKIAVYEDTEKAAAAIHEYSNSSKVNVEKEKAEEL